jgi:hypothetical protein
MDEAEIATRFDFKYCMYHETRLREEKATLNVTRDESEIPTR